LASIPERGRRASAPRIAALILVAALPRAAAPAAPPAVAAQPQELYTIGPGDVLQVFVWKEPELTRDVTVRLDGRITLPLIGDVIAVGRTPADLSSELTRQLARFLDTPMVTLGVAQATSARVYVLGQVMRPGTFPLTGRTTVLQALALAGGLKEFVKPERILVIREEPGLRAPLVVNYKRLEAGSDIGQNIVLKAGDTVLVP
jgi:polysaccharide export outer membrane protein